LTLKLQSGPSKSELDALNSHFNDMKKENDNIIDENRVLKAENEEFHELLDSHKKVIDQ
jgi:regulator of replication initiation timing